VHLHADLVHALADRIHPLDAPGGSFRGSARPSLNPIDALSV
jgi:hypothetical protein